MEDNEIRMAQLEVAVVALVLFIAFGFAMWWL
jgi:hypothetical protein